MQNNDDFDYLLISSSGRRLYQEDVFNSISLPNNYVIQYRYDLNYLDDEIKKGINYGGIICESKLETYFKNKKCILSYLNLIEEESEKDNYSLCFFRSGTIKEVIFNSKINRLLLYIELQDYISLENSNSKYINEVIEKFKLTSTCVYDLVSNNEIINEIKKVEFYEMAEKIIDLLPVNLIFSINLKKKINYSVTREYSKTITPKIDLSTNLTRYELTNRSNYFFEIITYEKKVKKENEENENMLIVDIQSDTIYLNQHVQNNGSNNINYIDLIIKPISAETVNTSVKFSEPSSNFITNILIDVKKSKIISLYFAISSLLVLIAVPIANYFKDQLSKSKFSTLDIFLSIGYIIATVIALRFLYRYFDKK